VRDRRCYVVFIVWKTVDVALVRFLELVAHVDVVTAVGLTIDMLVSDVRVVAGDERGHRRVGVRVRVGERLTVMLSLLLRWSPSCA
jgi:non-ribosomal peptide synthetase component F